MRNAIAIVLVLLLLTPAAPSASLSGAAKIKAKVSGLPGGTPIAVRLFDRTRLTGKLGAVSATGFALDVGQDGNRQPRTVAFSDVKSVRKDQPATPMSKGAKAGWAILIIGGLVAVGIGISCGASGGCSTN